MKDVKAITVKLPAKEGKAVDILVNVEKQYLNAADFVRTAVRQLLKVHRATLHKHGIELDGEEVA